MTTTYPVIDLNALFTPESNIESTLTEAALESNEYGNSLDLYMRLRTVSDSIENAMSLLKESALRIAQREKEYKGIPLTIRLNRTYEYNDPVIENLRNQIKEREALAKQAFTSNIEGIVVPETGEYIAAAKIKTSSESIQIKSR